MGTCSCSKCDDDDDKKTTPSTPALMSDEIIKKLSNSIIRIEYDDKISTGFFMKIYLKQKQRNFLITCEHCISQKNIDSKITVLIYYKEENNEIKKEIELNNNKRFMKCFIDIDIDVTIIEIIPEDNIPEDKYLVPDLNYKYGYEQYINKEIFIGGYSNKNKNKEQYYTFGKILGIKDNNGNFFHSFEKMEGLSCSPLININHQIIGINYISNTKERENYGIFVGVIIEKLYSEENKINFKAKEVSNITTYKTDDIINKEKEGKINNEIEEEKDNKILNIDVKKRSDNENTENINDNGGEMLNGMETVSDYEKINRKEDKKNFTKKDENINKKENEDKEIKVNGGFDAIIPESLKKRMEDFEKNNEIIKSNEEINFENGGALFADKTFQDIFLDFWKIPNLFEFANNNPEFNKSLEENPLLKESMKNPEMIRDFWSKEKLDFLSQLFFSLNNQNKKNKNEEGENNEIKNNTNEINNKTKNNNIKNEDINNSIINHEKFLQLKNMGFKNDELIKNALLLCNGNLEEAKEYIISAEHIMKNEK